jgi:hypothetical protein
MERKKREVPDPDNWTGSRVKFEAPSGARLGTVIRLASGKIPSAIVRYDDQEMPATVYLKDLTKC